MSKDCKSSICLFKAPTNSNFIISIQNTAPFLKALGIETNRMERLSNAALFEATKMGALGSLKEALENGADPNYADHAEDGHPTLLHEAVKARSTNDMALACTKLLLHNGADVDSTLITNYNTPLHEAASVGSENICRLLVEKMLEGGGSSEQSSNISYVTRRNSYGNTPLYAAVRSGSVETFRLLMEQGADMNIVNNVGSTILHLCAFMIKDVEITNTENGDIDFNHVEETTCSNERKKRRLPVVEPHLQIAAMVLACKNFTKIDTTDVNGFTALHVASQRGCIELVKLLLDSDASLTIQTKVDLKGRGGRTAADQALFCGMKDTHNLFCDGSRTVTGKMAIDLHCGYPMRASIAGSGAAAVKRKSHK